MCSKRTVSRCPTKRIPAGDIEQAVVEQLSAVFRTLKLAAKTYFAAMELRNKGLTRLIAELAGLGCEATERRSFLCCVQRTRIALFILNLDFFPVG